MIGTVDANNDKDNLRPLYIGDDYPTPAQQTPLHDPTDGKRNTDRKTNRLEYVGCLIKTI